MIVPAMGRIENVVKVSITDGEKRPVADIVLRKGTADERSVHSVIGKREYDISHLRRRDELLAVHRQIMTAGRTPLIVDLGANIGVSALYLNHVWPGSLIVAVEPEPENFRLLVLNTEGRPNIVPVHAGISSTASTLAIKDNNADTDAYRTIMGGDIPAISMATLLREHGGEPFLCKIDIEGAERDLFSRDVDWIDCFPLIMIELHDWMLCGEAASQNFLQAVSQRRRDFVLYGDTVFSIRC